MKHHLIFKDDKSDKFWQIEVSGKSFTVTFGKTGSAGTSQIKNFSTEEKCAKESQNLIEEKLKKGYRERNSEEGKITLKAEPDYLKAWRKIADAKHLGTALIAHFSYLADSPGFQPVLNAVMTAAKRVHINDQKLTIEFKKKLMVEASAPAPDVPKRYPATYKNVLEKHERLSLSGDIILGNHGFFEPEWLEEVESELLEITDPEKIISPLSRGSDCWVYHPKKKNSLGEPVLYFLSHEGGDIDRPQPLNIGSFFLSQLAEWLKLKVEIPVIHEKVSKKKEVGTEDWQKRIEVLYDGVKRYGKNESQPLPDAKKLNELFPKIKLLRFENLSTMEEIPFEKMLSLEELSVLCPLYGKKIPLTSLDGIEKASGLRELQLFGHKLIDISKLDPLSKLIRIDLACNKLKDISILQNFTQLEEIEISNNPVSDITPLSRLPKLKNLSLQSTNVKDITCLTKVKSLMYLTLPELDKSEINEFKKARPDVNIL